MSGTSSAHRRTTARSLLLVTVLLGLFLMHGAPTASAADCHSAPALTAPMTHHQHVAPSGQTAVHPHADGAGDSCLALPARTGAQAAAVPALLPVPVASAEPVHRAVRPLPHRRGPPTGGRDVLLLVCVARN